ncbi:MAG: histone deacetylase [Candidatus Solibacter usitatus]|nr:histone deacetylase [Candidatus Solibacter usitatus]
MPRIGLVYHQDYDLNFGDHVFPTVKYRLIRESLIAAGFAADDDFQRPEAATDADVALVHTAEWIGKLRRGTLSYEDVLRLEVPYSQAMVRAYWLAAGGTVLATALALQRGVGLNIGGGFHHAFPGHGEGFCAIHDVAIAVKKALQGGVVSRAMVIDCDVHHGNGTAAIFHNDPGVYTLSIHQYRNYPHLKPPSSLDIHLEDGAGDEEYLQKLEQSCRTAFQAFQPDILFYVAGADPYQEDQLGGLNLTMEGLSRRDHLVMDVALTRHIPVVIVLAGGYAADVADTVRIHCNTARAAEAALWQVEWRSLTDG